VPAVLFVVSLLVRTHLEDTVLPNQLEGYRDAGVTATAPRLDDAAGVLRSPLAGRIKKLAHNASFPRWRRRRARSRGCGCPDAQSRDAGRSPERIIKVQLLEFFSKLAP